MTGDEAGGGDPALATALRGHCLGYVLAVACSHQVSTGVGKLRVDRLAAGLTSGARQRRSAGAGAKGHRFYDWAWVPLPAHTDTHGGHHWLLIRRNRRTGALAALVSVAGRRWQIEESFQAAKTALGLDHHQNRRWISWHRWTTLAILAHAFLAATGNRRPDHPGLIAATVNELHHLLNILIMKPSRPRCDPLAWSIRRRRHQSRAQASHYARQALTEP